ncbi:hypothetical protein NDU88_005196 [Pleurodeles waltl]|uniref:Uncharacterized protein n=1 Tax=Pleurodeles waltl TaxID=8319 RepID=A0AAV7MZS4_PLEWA|nr:hypothetical protein NDU88_005196 [Pleurodeles waltl]
MWAATWELAPNGASGVVAVRRVQLHPSRFSLSAEQTVKSRMGPPYRQPFPGGSNCQEKAGGRGTRNPLGSAASSAAMADYYRRGHCGGKPPAPAVRPQRFRRGHNDPGSTASLLPVLPSFQPWRSCTARVEINPLCIQFSMLHTCIHE